MYIKIRKLTDKIGNVISSEWISNNYTFITNRTKQR